MKKIVLCTLLMGFLSACEKSLLDPQMDNQQTMERVLRDPAYAEGLLIGAYRNLPTAYSFSEVATDDAVTNEKGSTYSRMATGEWSALFSPVSVWNSSYEAISNLNLLVSIIDQIEWSTQSAERNELFKKKNRGEALALRGYFYLQLLMKHGGLSADGQLTGVPLITEPVGITDAWQIPRATFQQVMDQINADFDEAIKLVPYEWTGSGSSDPDFLRVMGSQSMGRIQGKITTALKAKAALLAASPAFNGGSYDILKAEKAAALTAPLLIEKGGVNQLPAKGIVFYDVDADISNPEIFWRNDFAVNNTLEVMNFPPSLFGNGRINPTQNLVDAFPMRNGYPVGHALSNFNPANPYANRDTRLAANIITHNSAFKSLTINTAPASPTLDGLNRSLVSTRTGYYLKKLLRANVNLTPAAVTTARHFYTHIRYTELYLNYAEAANEAWGPNGDPNGYGLTPRSIIAKIRNRAGITAPDPYLASITTKEAMRELIRNERRLELCFEDHRFWDLRRWQSALLNETAKGVSVIGNVFNVINVENRIFPTPASYYGPIPQQEIIRNNLIKQNIGW